MPSTAPMSDFSRTIYGWHDYFMLLGTASATLLGLLFVVVSLNVRAVEQGEHGQLRWIAAQTFNNFAFPLILSFVFLIPSPSRPGLGYSMIGVGATGVAVAAASLSRGGIQPGMAFRHVRRLLILPVLAHACTICVGYAVLNNRLDFLSCLIGATLALVASGSRAAWELLFQLGTDDALRQRDASENHAGED